MLANRPGLRQIETMPIPMEFLRGLLGALCVFFAHFLGRSVVRVQEGRQKQSKALGWAVRTLITGSAILYRHPFDAVAVVVFVLAAAAAAAGAWDEYRPKQAPEDLTKKIFPQEQDRPRMNADKHG
jgi:hypothetical protein